MSSPATSVFRLRVLSLVTALFAAWGASPAWGQSHKAQIPLLDEKVCFIISEVKQLIVTGDRVIRDGDPAVGDGVGGSAAAHREAMDLLQRCQERVWGKNLLYISDDQLEGGMANTSISATKQIISLLRGLPPSATSIYRKKYEPAARALYEHAIAARDIDRLVKCYEVYCLTEVAGDAALAAGDLSFERGDVLRAQEAWNAIDPILARLEVWKERLRRGLLYSAHEQDPDAYRQWHLLASESGVDLANVAPEPTAPPEGDPLAGIPELPFRRGKMVWQTDPPYNAYDQHRYETVDYAQQPCVGDDWVTVSTLKSIRRYHLESGKLLGNFKFRLFRDDRFHYDREKDSLLRIVPVTDGATLVTSYVADANLEDDFFGYDIKISIPQRGLIAMPVEVFDSTWFTFKPRRLTRRSVAEKSRDRGLVEQLSFNSVPVIVGDRVYALGWRQAGYVVSYLVCLDLETGAPQWTTILAGNQVELTMFGELAAEPFLGGLLFEDGMLYAQTNLGAFAKVRARDGRIEWLTEYPAVEIHPARRHGQGRRVSWDRNPIVSFADRVIATPLDSEFAFAFHKRTGRVLQSVRERSLGRYLLGRHGSSVVFADKGRTLVVAPGRDLNAGMRLILDSPIRTRPGLVRAGLVYSISRGWLCYRPFDASQEELVLFSGSSPRRDFNSRIPTDGFVTVLADRILVTNSYQTRCFKRATPEPPKENR